MNKASLLLGGFMIISIAVQSQLFSNYGIISQEERQLKECVFDKEAEAVYLLHEGISSYNEQYNLITEHHVRIKILKEKGLEYANVTIPFYSDRDFEFISKIEGVVINYDEQGNRSDQRLDKKSIYSKKTTKYHSEISFAFPSVKAGSIIEYEYRSTMKHYGGLDDWTFQEDLPVMKSTYSLSIIPNHEFSYLFKKSPLLPADVKNDPKSGQIHFAMNNIPGLRNEPFMDARKDYLQRVTFQLAAYNNVSADPFSQLSPTKTKYSATWQQVIEEMINSKSFGGQLSKNLDGNEEFMKGVKASNSSAEKMKLVLNHVRAHMSWNHITSRFSPDGIKNAWSKKNGTNGEINLILINLLKEAELETYPLLVSERENGKINKDYPSVEQFNTVYAYVIADNKKYYLDANDKFTPIGIIPEAILNTTALIVNRKSGGLVTVTDEELLSRDLINISAKLTEDGKIDGSAFLTSHDYARVKRLREYYQGKEKYFEDNFRKHITGIQIDSFALKNEQIDSLQLEQEFSFHFSAQQTGEYFFLPVNLFSGFEKNPFVANNRFTHINFGYKQYLSINTIIQLPKTVTVDALPKPVKLVNGDETVVLTRQITKDESNNTVVARINIELKKSLYTTAEYDAVKDFYKKMFALLDEQVVLKKKK